jgi:hypothetical protein
VSMAGAAGCAKRKSKSNRATAGTADRRASPTSSDPAGATCTDVRTGVGAATRMTWRADDAQATPRDEDRSKAGPRRCYFETSATPALPAVKLVVTFYRIDRRVDRTPDDVRRKAAEFVKCTEPLASPPNGVTLAVQCLEKPGTTTFNVNTLYSGPTGYVMIWVSMSPTRASTTLHTKAREIGRQAVGVTYDLI